MATIKQTPYQVAEFIQTQFSFNDDYDVINVNLNCRWQWIFGDDCTIGHFRDHDDIRSDMNGFYRAVKELATRIYGELPF